MKGDIQTIGGNTVTPILPFRTDDRTTSSASATVKPGEPLKGLSNTNFVLLCADGDPEAGTDAFVGIAERESDETSSAEGTVDASVCVPFITKMRAKATTVANIDTDAKLKAFLQNSVTFNLTNGVFTLNEDETSDPNVHAFVIVDGDIAKGTLDFYCKPLNTLFGNAL